MVRRRLEQALDLVGREGDRLAKSIDAGRDTLLRSGRNQLVDDLADIMGAAVALVGGQRVEREQGGNDPHRFALTKLTGDPEQPQLALRVETIAGLDLDGRAAAAHQRVQAAPALLKQLVVGCAGGALHGRGDAAARLGDLLVGRAGAAHRMLVGAGAAEDEVRVAVDQAGRDPGAAERDDLLRAKARKLGALADADDLAVGNPDRAILDQAERIARRAPRRSRSCSRRAAGPTCSSLRRALLLRSKRERLAQPFRPGCRRRAGGAGRPGRRSAGRGIGDAGPMRPGARSASRRRLRRIGRYDVETRPRTVDADRATAATPRSPDCRSKRRRPDHARRSASSSASCADAARRRQQCGDAAGRARARPAARQGRADHARRPFRHARHARGPEQRQSGAGADRGWAAGQRTSRKSGSPASPTAARCTRTRSPPAIWSSPSARSARTGSSVAVDRALEHARALRGNRRRLRHRRHRPRSIPGRARGPAGRHGGRTISLPAVRRLAADPRVRVIDLTEWDPPLDPTDLSALTAARWVAECLAGFEMR